MFFPDRSTDADVFIGKASVVINKSNARKNAKNLECRKNIVPFVTKYRIMIPHSINYVNLFLRHFHYKIKKAFTVIHSKRFFIITPQNIY